MPEKSVAKETQSCSVIRKQSIADVIALKGTYSIKCYDKQGRLKWYDTIDNLVTTVGKNLALDTLLAGSSYSVTGPYMGLISSVGYSEIVAGDTMASHAGWAEAGSGTDYPLYNGTRKTCVFSAAAAGAKALSSALSFTIETTGGTIKGCFIVLGTGAVATIADTGGVLLSAGLFTGGDKVVSVSDVVNVSYSLGMNA
jgi:hypothetical protein